MRTISLILFLLCALPAWADNVPSSHLVDIDGGKAVLFDDTMSPDGNYAIGWTLVPHTVKIRPVDWSLYKPDDPEAIDKFLQKYAPYLPDKFSGKGEYELFDCVIDLKKKQIIPIPSDDPNYPGKSRGGIDAAWSPAGKGTRFALVNNEGPSWSQDLWLIILDDAGMHQIPVLDTVEKSTAPFIAKKRPKVHKGYETTFCVGNDNPQGTTPLTFHESTVTFPFFADINQSTEDNTQVEGYITLKLPEGSVLKVTSD